MNGCLVAKYNLANNVIPPPTVAASKMNESLRKFCWYKPIMCILLSVIIKAVTVK